MKRSRKSRQDSSSSKHGRWKKESSVESKVSDNLPPVETVFPFLYFQSDFDLSGPESVFSRRSELVSSNSLTEDSFDIQDEWLSFPIYSQYEWLWLGEDGFDEPPLEPIHGEFFAEQSTVQKPCNTRPERDIGTTKITIPGGFPSNPIESDQCTSQQVPMDLSINGCSEKVSDEKRDCVLKKVRFADQKLEQIKRKAEPGLERFSKEVSLSKEFNKEGGLFSTAQSNRRLEPSSRTRYNFAQKYAPSMDPVRSKPVKESKSVECISFNNVSDIQAFASSLLKNEKPKASHNNEKPSVTLRSSTYGQGKTYSKNPKRSLHATGSPLKDRQEGLENVGIQPNSENPDIRGTGNCSIKTYSKKTKTLSSLRATKSPLKDGEDSMMENPIILPNSKKNENFSVDFNDLENCSVDSKKLENCSVDSKKLENCSVDHKDLKNCSVENLENSSVDYKDLENSSVDYNDFDNCSVDSYGSSDGQWDPRRVLKEKPGEDVIEDEQPLRRSTRIHLRQARGKINNLFKPFSWEDEEWLA